MAKRFLALILTLAVAVLLIPSMVPMADTVIQKEVLDKELEMPNSNQPEQGWFDPIAGNGQSVRPGTHEEEGDCALITSNYPHQVDARMGWEKTNVSEYDYLEFDFYIPDTNYVSDEWGFAIELKSTEYNPREGNRLVWNASYHKGEPLKEGWNSLKLAIKGENGVDFTAPEGEAPFDPTQAQALWIWNYIPADQVAEGAPNVEFMVDNIRFTKYKIVEEVIPDPSEPSDPSDPGEGEDDGDSLMISNCDDPAGWACDPATIGAALESVDRNGTGDALKFSVSDSRELVMTYDKTGEKLDVTGATYLEFDIWLSEGAVEAVLAGIDKRVELTSGGNDAPGVCWGLPTNLKANEWQHVQFDMRSATVNPKTTENGGTLEEALQAIDHFRLFTLGDVGTAYDMEIRLDNVEVTFTPYPVPEPLGKGELSKCESEKGWSATAGIAVSADAENKQEGDASVRFTAPAGQTSIEMMFRADAETVVDLSDASHLQFWLYIEDADFIANITDSRIELSSSDTPDDALFFWGVDVSALKQGWNLIKMPMSEGGRAAIMELVDLRKIVRFRVFFTINPMETEQVLNIDDLKGVFENEEEPPTSDGGSGGDDSSGNDNDNDSSAPGGNDAGEEESPGTGVGFGATAAAALAVILSGGVLSLTKSRKARGK